MSAGRASEVKQRGSIRIPRDTSLVRGATKLSTLESGDLLPDVHTNGNTVTPGEESPLLPEVSGAGQLASKTI